MRVLVTGGSGSGKSSFAEEIITGMSGDRLVYIATMIPYGYEGKLKVEKHRKMRADKEFITIERYLNLKSAEIYKNDCVIIECMSNLLANEMFEKDGAKDESVKRIIDGINYVSDKAANTVFVSNDIFRDGYVYDEETEKYIENLAVINRYILEKSDEAYEIVCGIPIKLKGAGECLKLLR